MRALVVAMLLATGIAHAQAPDDLTRPDSEKAEADRLFEEGRRLLGQGKRVEACAAFEQSIRKDPRAVGTLLNLGLCNEQTGKTATAVRYFAEARDAAHDQGLHDHEDAAARKLALLSPRVPHLSIEAAPLEARVLLDNLVLTRPDLDDVIADPGKHTVTVTVPGKLPYEATVTLEEGKPSVVVRVPALEGAKTVVVERRTSHRRMWGKIATVSGAGIVVGALALGYVARTNYWDQFPAASRDGQPARDAQHDCWTTVDGRACNALGAEKIDSARTLAHVATGTAIVGGLALGTGLYLWLTAPRDSEVRVTASIAHDSAGVLVFGRF